MKVSSYQIFKNTFIDFSLNGSSLIIDDINYNNIYTVIISFYNNSYSIKGFDFYEKKVFNISKNLLSCVEFIKLSSKCYKLYIS